MSIGLDAKVAIEFHSHRNANPHLYTGQNVNKVRLLLLYELINYYSRCGM